MRPKISRGKMAWISIALICVAIFSFVYYTSTREVTDPDDLSSRVGLALNNVDSYRFTITTNLSVPMQKGSIQMIEGSGALNYKRQELHTKMDVMNDSMEVYFVDNTLYTKEPDKQWEVEEQKFNQTFVWKNNYDQLSRQRFILLNATNITMHEKENVWVLEILPEKEGVIQQLEESEQLESFKGEQLKDVRIRYWIDKDNFYITRMENSMELEMNIQGLITPVTLNTSIDFFEYNQEIEIQPPF